MLPDIIKATPLDSFKKVTRVQSLCDILNNSSGLKQIISEVHKLLKIYLTIPVTTASSERTFSSLKHIKPLCNSMTQEHINHCLMLHVHHHKIDNLNLVELLKNLCPGVKEGKTFKFIAALFDSVCMFCFILIC